MAQSDLDSMKTGIRQEADPVEAGEQLAGFEDSIVDTDAKARAEAEGVLYAAFIDYDVALDKYAARGDVEDLAHKNARNHPDDFADADFMRKPGDGDHGSSGVS